MKTPKSLALALVASLIVGAAQSWAAPDFTSAANTLAEEFLLQPKHADSDWPAFLKQQGIEDGPAAEACRAALTRARELEKCGVKPGKPAFALFLGSTDKGSTRRVTPPVEPKEDQPTSTNSDVAQAEPALKTWPPGAQSNLPLFFHSGVRVLAPFKIDYATHKLSSEGTTTGGFLELVGANLWNWQPARIQQARDQYLKQRNQIPLLPYDWEFVKPGVNDASWDYLGRLSFEFGSDQEASASTITGSGDVSAELAVSRHVLRGWTPDGAWSLGLGSSITATTDRQARVVHRAIFAGLNTATSFAVGEDKRLALLRLNFGAANLDGVVYDDRTQSTIQFDGAVPKFERRWRPAAEAELWWPMSGGGYLTAGAKLYGDHQPDQWSLYLGVTLDIAKAIAALNPAANTKPKETKPATE